MKFSPNIYNHYKVAVVNLGTGKAVNGVGLTYIYVGLYQFIAGKFKILYPWTRALIDSIK